MKKITIRLKTEIIKNHPIYPIGSIKEAVYLSEENPVIELNADDAALVLESLGIFEFVSEREEADLTKEQLQALFVETIGADPDKRLSPAKLKQAIDEYNANVPVISTPQIGLADIAVPVVDAVVAPAVDAPVVEIPVVVPVVDAVVAP